MEILPFLQNVKTLSSSGKSNGLDSTSTSSSSLGFRNLLSRTSMGQQTQSDNHMNFSHSEKISPDEIMKDLNSIVEQISLNFNASETFGIDKYFDEPLENVALNTIINENSGIPTIVNVINNEVKDVLAENQTMKDLAEKIKNKPSVVNILSVVKAIEFFNPAPQLDLKQVLSGINTFLEQEFPSFKNNETPSLENMLKSMANMDSKDQAKLVGQILHDRLLDQELKKETIGVFDYHHDTLLNTSDLQMIQSILMKTDNHFLLKNTDRKLHTVNNFDEYGYFMTVNDKKNEKEFSLKLFPLKTVEENVQPELSKYKQSQHIETLPFHQKSNESLKHNIDDSKNVLKEKIHNGSNRETINTQFQSIKQPVDNQIQVEKFVKEIREETYGIQLNHLSSSENESQGSAKTDLSTRQEFTNQLLNVFKNSKFAQMPNGTNRLILKLNPEHLGVITVKLIQKNGEMVARLITSSGSAKDLLDHSIHQLKQVLPSVQIEIERFEVQIEQPQKTLKDHSEKRDDNSREHQQQHHDEENNREESFIDSLKEALNTTV